jgi:hypothetical protein
MLNNPVDVSLTWYEYSVAAHVANLRCIESNRDGRLNAHGFTKGSGWEVNVEGAGAELAVAKYFGWYWDFSVNTFKAPDLGSKVQVRWTHSHNFSLIVRPRDPEDDVYVLVSGWGPDYKIQGFMYGHEAKNQLWLRTESTGRPDAYMVPNDRLTPIEQLTKVLADVHA